MVLAQKSKEALERVEDIIESDSNHPISIFCQKNRLSATDFYGNLIHAYKAAALNEEFDLMQTLRESTGINPSADNRNLFSFIQGRYSYYIANKEYDKINALQEASGIPMNQGNKIGFLARNLNIH